jgi:plasmid stability protein
MSKMIQVRNVPDTLHRTLKARAALAGMSLSDFLLMEIRKVAEKPTPEEMLERLRRRRPVEPAEKPTDAVRAERAIR